MPTHETVHTAETDAGEVRFKDNGIVFVPHPRRDDRFIGLSEEVVEAINDYSDPTVVESVTEHVKSVCPYCAWEDNHDPDDLPKYIDCRRCDEPLLIRENE